MDRHDLVIVVIERLVIYSYSQLQLIGISHIFPQPLMKEDSPVLVLQFVQCLHLIWMQSKSELKVHHSGFLQESGNVDPSLVYWTTDDGHTATILIGSSGHLDSRRFRHFQLILVRLIIMRLMF